MLQNNRLGRAKSLLNEACQLAPGDADAWMLLAAINAQRGDFKQVAGDVLRYAARYVPELKASLDAGHRPTIAWLDYDWSLNTKENSR